jgi:hypothetical protein
VLALVWAPSLEEEEAAFICYHLWRGFVNYNYLQAYDFQEMNIYIYIYIYIYRLLDFVRCG